MKIDTQHSLEEVDLYDISEEYNACSRTIGSWFITVKYFIYVLAYLWRGNTAEYQV